MKLRDGARVWDVRFSFPWEAAGRQYRKNLYAMAIAETAHAAIDLVLSQFPEARVWQVNNRGQGVSVVIDPELME